MKITFLGTSSLLGDGYSSNILLDLGISGTLLIDCGFDIKHSLKESKRKVEEIKNIYISHLHGDHCLGLEYIGFYNKYILDRKISLYIHESYVDQLWDSLKPSMGKLSDGIKSLSDYFDVRPLKNYNSFMVGQHTFKIVKNKHIPSDNGSIFSYGLLWSRKGSYELHKESPEIENIYVSTDTINSLFSDRWPKEVINKVESCDLFFHEVDFYDTPCHSYYERLLLLPNNIKEKMWLYHYNEYKDCLNSNVIKDGFAGLVKQGQIFEFNIKDKINIFVLEDELERIKWFKKTFNDCSLFITCSVDEACIKLKENKYDLIFLDRDLGDTSKSGDDVAKKMEKDKLNVDACIVVHTLNPVGKINIKSCLNKHHKNVNFIDFTSLKKMKREDFQLRI